MLHSGQHLFYVSSALGVFRSNGRTKGASYRKGPPRDSKDATVPKKAREFFRFHCRRHDHHFQRERTAWAGLTRIREVFFQEAQKDILQEIYLLNTCTVTDYGCNINAACSRENIDLFKVLLLY